MEEEGRLYGAMSLWDYYFDPRRKGKSRRKKEEWRSGSLRKGLWSFCGRLCVRILKLVGRD